MVVVVVPLLVVVVDVELFVVLTGQETLCAWMTTPGPKLQLLADDGDAVEGVAEEEVVDNCAPLAPLSKIVMVDVGVEIGVSPMAFVVFTILVVIGANGVRVVAACCGTTGADVVGEELTGEELGDEVLGVGAEGAGGAITEPTVDFGTPVVAAAVAALESPKSRKVAITTSDCKIRASALRRTNNRPGRDDRRAKLIACRRTRMSSEGTVTQYP